MQLAGQRSAFSGGPKFCQRFCSDFLWHFVIFLWFFCYTHHRCQLWFICPGLEGPALWMNKGHFGGRGPAEDQQTGRLFFTESQRPTRDSLLLYFVFQVFDGLFLDLDNTCVIELGRCFLNPCYESPLPPTLPIAINAKTRSVCCEGNLKVLIVLPFHIGELSEAQYFFNLFHAFSTVKDMATYYGCFCQSKS